MIPLFKLPQTLFGVFTIFIVTVSASSKVKLIDVKTLTLYQNEMTTFRRTSAVPQLKCVGGSAGCSSYQPKVVQCYNRGSDGIDVQWECKADMERPYSFGKIEVVCEGYDYPDDPYILKGSCGMEYKLENDGSGGKTSGWTTGSQSGKSSGFGDFILIIVVAIMIYGIYVTCIGNQQQHQYSPTDDTDDNHRPYGNPGFGGGGGSWFRRSGPAPPGFRPEYSSGPSCGGGTGTYTSGPSSGGGGFWTGAATGGLLGYMFGSRGSGYNSGYGSSGYGSSGYGGFGGSSGFGASTSGFGGSSSSRSSSGFGGTRRR